MSRPRDLSLAAVLFATASIVPSAGCTDSSTAPRTSGPPVIVPVADRVMRGGNMPAIPAPTPALSAIGHLHALAPQWGATQGLAELAPLATQKVAGGDIVRVRQLVDGVPVERGELRVLVGQGGTLLAATGVPVPADLPRDRTGFVAGTVRDGSAALAQAIHAVHGVDVPNGALTALAGKPGVADPIDPASWYTGSVGGIDVTQARTRRAWFRSDGALVPAWIVEAYMSPVDSAETSLHRVIVAARDGRVLEQKNLTVDAAFEYRVWAETTGDKRPLDGPLVDASPHPTGAPGSPRTAFLAPNNVSVDGLNTNPDGGGDPWLAAGATTTSGNNVDAYTDINSPNGFGGNDFRAATTGEGVFGRTYDTAQGPLVTQDQQMAAITQLFYSINWLHDEWYDAGFNEAAGNAQGVNYGRGGVEGDAIRAEAQDAANQGRRNNANMSTPEDGMDPVMQVYLWTGSSEQAITLTGFNTAPPVSGASYGPGSYDVPGTVVAGTDGTGASMTDGCEAITNDVTGRIVLLDRGNCTFKSKTLRAQQAGALGVIIANNQGSTPPSMPNDSMVTTAITIPTMGLSMADGATLRTSLGNGAVTTTLHRVQGVEADGSLDGGLVAHEFGHYVHHRLSTCGTAQCGAMSEGWGDFLAMHMIARPGDDLNKTFAMSAYAYPGDTYFGIRRVPYSVDMTKNAFTFGMVSDEAGLPTSHPTSGGGPNSEVHNAGEVWATVMWEVYVALQKMPGADFVATRDKMARYVVAGLSMAPPDGTFTEIRDAILAAAYAASPADHDAMAAAFGRRGLGTCAEAPARESEDFVGTDEAFEVSGRALPGTATVTLTNDCDMDGSLDAGDTATITVPIVNAGAIALTGGVSVAVTASTPGLTVPTAPVSIDTIAPYGAAMATFEVSVSGDVGAGPIAANLTVNVTAPGCRPTSTFQVPLRMQTDVELNASASDALDAVPSVWTATGDDGGTLWSHAVQEGLDRVWKGADAGTTSDTSLESPEMTGDGNVVISFDHKFDFEFSQDTYFDGGLIEVTTDGGTTWVDVATLGAQPGYNGVIGGDSGNPLDGASVYGGTNPAYPSTDRVSLDFGTALSGMTFKLRFRIATDAGVGAPGWEIDDIVVTGITGTPFPVQSAEDGTCGPGPDDGHEHDEGGCCSTGGMRSSDIAAAGLLGLALVL
ncbi:MAG TPA: M36 family metallopeptidase, partial [Kofleriaceae bacterium]|nr:M36 family metallopeptidase [Kofleriaceae bacterium]